LKTSDKEQTLKPEKTLLMEILRDEIRAKLPSFTRLCNQDAPPTILMHQDTFGISDEEMLLLGKAIKYGGSHGKTITVIP
jgi:hypothetical protein